MTNVNRWLLPEGIEEILPAEARVIEAYRRKLLDLYTCWGYELVMLPLLEFTDSLLGGVGSDINLLTLKVTDQMSGQLMGLRADITPQAARMDAHSYVKSGPNRLCYADYVVHAKPKSPLAVRTPLQVGVELFGETNLNADVEVISLLLTSLETISLDQVTLALGHVGLCRGLLDALPLSEQQKSKYFDLLQIKDPTTISQWAQNLHLDDQVCRWLIELPQLCGDVSVLEKARFTLQSAPAKVMAAIDELEKIYALIHQRFADVNIYLDLGEFRGYHYHTGIVFAAYIAGKGDAIANGGRYDHIGEAYGRARPATGFGINIISMLSSVNSAQVVSGIYAPPSTDPKQWQAIRALRAQGKRVVCGLSESTVNIEELRCDYQLLLVDGDYCVEALS